MEAITKHDFCFENFIDEEQFGWLQKEYINLDEVGSSPTIAIVGEYDTDVVQASVIKSDLKNSITIILSSFCKKIWKESFDFDLPDHVELKDLDKYFTGKVKISFPIFHFHNEDGKEKIKVQILLGAGLDIREE